MKLKNLPKVITIFTIVLFLVLPSLLIAIPQTAYADTTVTTGSATLDGETFTFNGSIQSTDTIQARGFQLDIGGETEEIINPSDSAYIFDSKIDSSTLDGFSNSKFYNPSAITTDSLGNIYVADSYNNRVQKFDSSGNFITKWGSSGSGEGQFSFPRGIGVDSSNNIYVTDSDNHRTQKFDSTGNFLMAFGWGVDDGTEEFQICSSDCQAGIIGSGDGQFYSPYGVDADSMGNVYIVEYYNHRIQKFDSSGNYVSKFGSVGVGSGSAVPGTFNWPSDVALDSNDNLYVVNEGNHRIDKFDNDYNFIHSVGGWGPSDDKLRYPTSIAIDSNDDVYIADQRNGYSHSKVKHFSGNTGAFISAFGTFGSNDSEFNYPRGIALDSSDNIYVADTFNNRIQKFDSSGNFITKWGSWGSDSFSPYGLVVDSVGNIYAGDSGRILKFNSSGVYQSQIGAYGNGDGLLNFPAGITIDSTNNIYAVDSGNGSIQKFDSSGNFITKWGSWGSGDGQFYSPYDITADSEDNIYVADTFNSRIQKFDSSGNFIMAFGWGVDDGSSELQVCVSDCQSGSEGSADGQFYRPEGVALDSSGYIYVADSSNNRIQKFDSAGNFITKWGTSGSGIGEFSDPKDIAVDLSDNIYVSDRANNRIQKFDSSGNYITKLGGTYGSDEGEFAYTQTVTVDSTGNIYTTENNVNRIQKFIPNPNSLANGNFSVDYADEGGDLAASICFGSSLQYRSYAVVNDQTIYGEFETYESDCYGADIKLDITLNSPGLIQGQDTSYSFTLSNVGGESYAPSQQDSLLIAAPDGLTMTGPAIETEGDPAFYTDGESYLCYDATEEIGSLPSLSYHLGTLYVCYPFYYNTDDISAGSSIDITMPFSVTNSVDNDTTLRAVYVGIEKDFGSIYSSISNSTDDAFLLPFNNISTYTGTEPGTTIQEEEGSGNIDSDSDSIPDSIENSAPNNGDANSDGIQDSTQPYVAVQRTPTGKYLAMSLSSDCTISTATTTTEDTNTTTDSAYTYPEGLLNFTADCGTPGYTTTANLYYYDTTPDNLSLRKYNPNTNAYFNLIGQYGATLDQTTIGNRNTTIASYQITDGQDLDIDNVVNGQIQDPVGIATLTTGAADTGLQKHWLLNLKY